MTSRLRLVAAAALTLAVLPLGATASAETWTRADARGDVLTVTSLADEETMTDDPANASGDVTRIRVRHAAKRLTIALTVRDADRRGDLALIGTAKTPNGTFEIVAIRTRGREHVMIYSLEAWQEGRCSGRSMALKGDRLTVHIPRTCLDDPRWVRVGAALVAGERGALSAEEGTVHVDDALRDKGARRIIDSDELTLSPKVRVG